MKLEYLCDDEYLTWGCADGTHGACFCRGCIGASKTTAQAALEHLKKLLEQKEKQ